MADNKTLEDFEGGGRLFLAPLCSCQECIMYYDTNLFRDTVDTLTGLCGTKGSIQ